jgi:hypothetical protein
VMELCMKCDEVKADERYPVYNGFEAWGAKLLGYECEGCAEAHWDQYQEWLAS